MTSKEAKDYLISLIERDTPMKPQVRSGGVFKGYNCSVCNSTVDILGVKEINFCLKCGQRLDYNGMDGIIYE